MIWFDLDMPKSALFFIPIIRELNVRGEKTIITTREGPGYTEVVELLRLYDIPFYSRGRFGGADIADKLRESISRTHHLVSHVLKHDVTKLVCLISVDANRTAFGLGIPIINFCDMPLADFGMDLSKTLPQARLTLPLSNKIFHPYMIPRELFTRFVMEEHSILTYHFLDAYMWLKDFVPDRSFYEDFLAEHHLDPSRPTIVIREEEFKASYVQHRYPLLYKGMHRLKKKIAANFVIIPRYEVKPLKKEFPFATVVEKKFVVQHVLAFADLFVGGGGTMNSEACFFGTPTISTRSFICHYDKLLIDHGLMVRANTVDDLVALSIQLLGQRIDSKGFFDAMELNLDHILNEIISTK
ncbi:MAG: DUF354 domain-containing protein [Deltaproteobacteria bacterium]|nr:DUF354 domain-containing protein [Deltaproteobacteria bacterium]